MDKNKSHKNSARAGYKRSKIYLNTVDPDIEQVINQKKYVEENEK